MPQTSLPRKPLLTGIATASALVAVAAIAVLLSEITVTAATQNQVCSSWNLVTGENNGSAHTAADADDTSYVKMHQQYWGAWECTVGKASAVDARFTHNLPGGVSEGQVYRLDYRLLSYNCEHGSCNDNQGTYYYYNYGSSSWTSLGWDSSTDASTTICSTKASCANFIGGASSNEMQIRYYLDADCPGDDDGANLDHHYFTVYYDQTAPTMSWSSDTFSTYSTDGNESATLSISDTESQLKNCTRHRYVNGAWNSESSYCTGAACNGAVCNIPGSPALSPNNNTYIRCRFQCWDNVDNEANLYTTAGLGSGTLVDFNDPTVSTPSATNGAFSPNNSAGVKDNTTASSNITDGESGVDCWKMTVKDSSEVLVRDHTTGSCSGWSNSENWTANPVQWTWDGKNNSSAFVADGVYRVYVQGRDNAGRISPASGNNETQYCAAETVNNGTSVAGNCASTQINDNTNYRRIDEANVATTEDEVATGASMNFGNNNSGNYTNTQADDGSKWDFREATDWGQLFCSPACWIDVDMYYNTDVPEGTITSLELYTNYDTDADNEELYWYNYDSGWSDRGTGVPSGQSNAYWSYTLCSGAGNCNPWVSSAGNITMSWYDENDCFENEDYMRIDYQRVRVSYNQRKVDVQYRFDTTQAENQITSINIATDAYCSSCNDGEVLTIYKYKYSTSSWVATGYTAPSTEPGTPQTIAVCVGSECPDYINDAGATRQFQIRYLHTLDKDATVSRLNIDYQLATINYGSSGVDIIVDNTNPATTDDWTNNWTALSPVTVTLSPTDNLAGVEWTKYCVDTTNTCDPTAGTTGTVVSVTCAAGTVCTQYVRYASKDNAGNTESTKSETVRQDLQAPSTSDNWTDNWTATSPVGITLSPSDGSGSGMAATYYCVDTANSCSPTTSGTSVSVTCAAGSVCNQFVRYYSTDVLGNVEGVKSKRVRQDLEVPAAISLTNIEGDTAATYYDNANDADTDITISTSDGSGSGVSTCRWATTDIAYGSMTNTCTSTSLCEITGATTEGSTYTRYLACVDAVGNEHNAAANLAVTWTNDYTAPSISLTNVEGDTAATYYDTTNDSNTDITISTTDGVSGPTTCKWDTTDIAYGSMANTCTSTSLCTIGALAESGTAYTRYIACTDAAGNGNSSTNNIAVSWINDWTAPPVPTISSVTNTGNLKLTVNWSTVTDNASGLANYELDRIGTGQIATPAAAAVSYQDTVALDNTEYCYQMRSKDNASNVSGNSTQVCSTAIIGNETIAAEIKGYPVSAVDQSPTYIGTYVGAGTTVYLLSSNGTQADSEALPGASGTLIGAPYWIYNGATDYVYVVTTGGQIYRLINTATGDPTPPNAAFMSVDGAAVYATLPTTCGATPVPTTGAIVDDKLIYLGAKVSACTKTGGAGPDGPQVYIFGIEIDDAWDSDTNSKEVIVNQGGCEETSEGTNDQTIRGEPAVKGTWPTKYIHIGSSCPTTELYRVKMVSPPGPSISVDCNKNVAGEISGWLTGSFGKLFFGTLGGAAARLYVAQNSENAPPCSDTSPDAYSDLFTPYNPGGASVSRGAKVNWTGALDEAYFVDESGKVHCVCQNTGTGCASVGAACSGFPVDLGTATLCGTTGVTSCGVGGGNQRELREPILKDGTLYVPCNSGKIFSIETLDDPVADNALGGEVAFYDPPGAPATLQAPPDIPSGTIKLRNGFPFLLGQLMCSTAALRTSGDTRITVGTDVGKVFYLPLIANDK